MDNQTAIEQIQVNSYEEFLDRLYEITDKHVMPFSGNITHGKDIDISVRVINNEKEIHYKYVSDKYIILKDILDSLVDDKYAKKLVFNERETINRIMGSLRDFEKYLLVPGPIKRDRRIAELQNKEKVIEKVRQEDRWNKEFNQRETQFIEQMKRWEDEFWHTKKSAIIGYIFTSITLVVAIVALFKKQ